MFIVITILGAIIIYNTNKQSKEEKEISYTELVNKIENGNVEKVELTVDSTVAKIKLMNDETEKEVSVPDTEAFIELVQEKIRNGSNLELIQKEPNIFITILRTLLSFLPTLLLIGLIVYMFKMLYCFLYLLE